MMEKVAEKARRERYSKEDQPLQGEAFQMGGMKVSEEVHQTSKWLLSICGYAPIAADGIFSPVRSFYGREILLVAQVFTTGCEDYLVAMKYDADDVVLPYRLRGRDFKAAKEWLHENGGPYKRPYSFNWCVEHLAHSYRISLSAGRIKRRLIEIGRQMEEGRAIDADVAGSAGRGSRLDTHRVGISSP